MQAQEAWAYVDPGTGFVFLQGAAPLWAFLLLLFLLPIKFLFKFIKKYFWIILIIVIILIIGGLILKSEMGKAKDRAKVIVLGFDAMDHSITERLMAEGRLPNFSYLKDRGSFAPLATTNPSESVVAWTTFATGLGPARHGIFDFVMRDPKNYFPYLAFSESPAVIAKQEVKTRKKAEGFWHVLSRHGISSHIYFCPNTFPPDKFRGKMLSGMGTPDLLGMMGRFSFYTTRRLMKDDADSRGRIVGVELADNSFTDYLYGPKVKKDGSVSETKIPMKVVLDPRQEKISVRLQGNSFELSKDKWSAWQRVYFDMGFFKKVYGMARFYLKSVSPDIQLYASPVNLDPVDPAFPISYPSGLSRRLAKDTGLFYTQGMPHDTWPLSEGRLDEKAFLEMTDNILAERKKILLKELKNFKNGLFFFYFDTLDAVQHMFWRYIDPKHPLYEQDSAYQDTIFKYYERLDGILGDVLRSIDDNTTLIVLSDHGFTSFRRAAHLNRWLLENGFLSLKEGKSFGGEFFEDIDWPNTKAYALGFGGIYLNLSGREGKGIVKADEADGIKRKIKEGLLCWVDSKTGENVVKGVYFQEEVFPGASHGQAPELFVGFNAGYRASWQTALGGVPEALIEDNLKKWSGDHLVDPSLVPGVLFVNTKISESAPAIIDIASMLLSLFGASDAASMEGRPLLPRSGD